MAHQLCSKAFASQEEVVASSGIAQGGLYPSIIASEFETHKMCRCCKLSMAYRYHVIEQPRKLCQGRLQLTLLNHFRRFMLSMVFQCTSWVKDCSVITSSPASPQAAMARFVQGGGPVLSMMLYWARQTFLHYKCKNNDCWSVQLALQLLLQVPPATF